MSNEQIFKIKANIVTFQTLVRITPNLTIDPKIHISKIVLNVYATINIYIAILHLFKSSNYNRMLSVIKHS